MVIFYFVVVFCLMLFLATTLLIIFNFFFCAGFAFQVGQQNQERKALSGARPLRHPKLNTAGLLVSMDLLSPLSSFSEGPWGFYHGVLYNIAFYLICTFLLLVAALAVMFISWRRSTFIEDVERSIVQLIADFAFSRIHLCTRFISWINGYQDFA